MTTTTAPTQPRTRLSGCARRRAKAIARREHVSDLRANREMAAGRIPHDAIAVASCSCGWASWVRPPADAEAHEDHLRAADDHADQCNPFISEEWDA